MFFFQLHSSHVCYYRHSQCAYFWQTSHSTCFCSFITFTTFITYSDKFNPLDLQRFAKLVYLLERVQALLASYEVRAPREENGLLDLKIMRRHLMVWRNGGYCYLWGREIGVESRAMLIGCHFSLWSRVFCAAWLSDLPWDPVILFSLSREYLVLVEVPFITVLFLTTIILWFFPEELGFRSSYNMRFEHRLQTPVLFFASLRSVSALSLYYFPLFQHSISSCAIDGLRDSSSSDTSTR